VLCHGLVGVACDCRHGPGSQGNRGGACTDGGSRPGGRGGRGRRPMRLCGEPCVAFPSRPILRYCRRARGGVGVAPLDFDAPRGPRAKGASHATLPRPPCAALSGLLALYIRASDQRAGRQCATACRGSQDEFLACDPLVSSTHRAACSADAVARLALASENEQRGVGGGGWGARGDAHQNQGTGNDSTKRAGPRRLERRKRRSSKTTSLRNHEKLRRAVFEHRHHRKAPAELAGP
jgi:hypothetical protein